MGGAARGTYLPNSSPNITEAARRTSPRIQLEAVGPNKSLSIQFRGINWRSVEPARYGADHDWIKDTLRLRHASPCSRKPLATCKDRQRLHPSVQSTTLIIVRARHFPAAHFLPSRLTASTLRRISQHLQLILLSDFPLVDFPYSIQIVVHQLGRTARNSSIVQFIIATPVSSVPRGFSTLTVSAAPKPTRQFVPDGRTFRQLRK